MHRATSITLLGIILGVILGEKTQHGSVIASVASIVSIVTCSIYFFERRHISKEAGKEIRKSTQHNFFLSQHIALFCIALTLGIIRTQFEPEKNKFVCERSCTFQATVVSSAKEKDVYQVLNVHPEVTPATMYVQVRAPLYPKFQIGETLTLTGVVSLPKSFVQTKDKQLFDYGAYLSLHDVGSEMFYPKMETVTSIERSTSIFLYLQSLREIFVNIISVYVDEPAAALAGGMLFGSQTMSQEVIQTFRATGLSHIVVLSGFNIAILISFVLMVLVVIPLVARIFFSAVVVIFFVIMVGAEVSVVRATLMSGVALVALLVGRAYSARQALLLSLIAIIMFEPKHLLYDVSLHLSFLATAGIIYLQESLGIIFKKVTSKTYREILTTTSAAYLATLPYVMYTFGTVSLYALVANALVLPIVPIMMFVTFLVVVTAPIASPLGLLFGYVDSLLGDVIIYIARSIERLPFSSIEVSVSYSMMLVAYIGITCFSYFFRIKKENETSHTKDDSIISGIISY